MTEGGIFRLDAALPDGRDPTRFLIGAVELHAWAAGQPTIVVAPGMTGLESLPIAVLQPVRDTLRWVGAPEAEALPLPTDFQPLATLAPDEETAASLTARLPPGIAVLVGPNPLPALLARLAESLAASEAANRRALGQLPPQLHGQFKGSAPSLTASPRHHAPDIAAEMAPTGADFQDLKLYQHNLSADGGYRHLDLGLIGLASASGIWREARLKLFDRRGIIGMEFRNLRGWPKVFDPWPEGGSDRFGPFWRLESQGVPAALASLSSLQNRAVVAALLEVLPAAAREGAALAELSEQDREAWVVRGTNLGAAVAMALHSPATTAGTPAVG
ncbi:hypothetical protein [Falsiroseomonas sp. E2-1-a20]|uniref:hypothetical protein n=1 Tax=Falsiroseomonas sp. E2-1-a20 TaxID=3239300 RepID=UPI003F2C37C6